MFSCNRETPSGVRNRRSQFFRSSLVQLSLYEAGGRRKAGADDQQPDDTEELGHV